MTRSAVRVRWIGMAAAVLTLLVAAGCGGSQVSTSSTVGDRGAERPDVSASDERGGTRSPATRTASAGRTAAGHDRILFQSIAPGGGDTLYTMRQNGSGVQQLPLEVPGSAISPDWSPDGKRITFTVQASDTQSIWTARADGKNARELFHCAGECLGTDYPAWSPDGRSIAFTYAKSPPTSAGPPSATSIRIIDLQSHDVRVIARGTFPSLIDFARWSPGGGRLVVQRDRFSPSGDETGCRIEIVRVRDGHIRPLTSYERFGFHPDWSATGKLLTFDTYDLLAYGDSAPGPSNLFTIRPDGSRLRQLTHFELRGNRVSAATFAPDGAGITFTYQVNGRRAAGTISERGGAIRTVPAEYGGPVTHPRLSPPSSSSVPARRPGPVPDARPDDRLDRVHGGVMTGSAIRSAHEERP